MSVSYNDFKIEVSRGQDFFRNEQYALGSESFKRCSDILLKLMKKEKKKLENRISEEDRKKSDDRLTKFYELAEKVASAGRKCVRKLVEEKKKKELEENVKKEINNIEIETKSSRIEVPKIEKSPPIPSVSTNEKDDGYGKNLQEEEDNVFIVHDERNIRRWEHKVKKKPVSKKGILKKRYKGSDNKINTRDTSPKKPSPYSEVGNKKPRRKRVPGYLQGTKSSGKKHKNTSSANNQRKEPVSRGVGGGGLWESRKKSPSSRKVNNNKSSSSSSSNKSPSINNNRKRGKKKKVHIVEPQPSSEFTRACCSGDLEVLSNCLVDPFFNTEDSDVQFGLHYAAYHENLEACKKLIQSGFFNLEKECQGASVVEYSRDEVVCLALKVFTLLHTELQHIIGLEDVKDHLYALANKIILDKKREREGLSISKKTYDMIFKGNPGTGKTSIASVICKMYHAFEIITNPSLKCVQRGDLVAGYIGKTALKTREVIENQRGGILLVDEAYRLSSGGEKDFGKEAIEELMQAMNGESGIIFIFAGYEKDMDKYVQMNEGLFRRIAYRMKFEDFSAGEVAEILNIKVKGSEYVFAPDIDMEYLTKVIEYAPQVLRAKMNGGMAQKLMEYSVDELNRELTLDAKGDDLIRIERRHLEKAMRKNFMRM